MCEWSGWYVFMTRPAPNSTHRAWPTPKPSSAVVGPASWAQPARSEPGLPGSSPASLSRFSLASANDRSSEAIRSATGAPFAFSASPSGAAPKGSRAACLEIPRTSPINPQLRPLARAAATASARRRPPHRGPPRPRAGRRRGWPGRPQRRGPSRPATARYQRRPPLVLLVYVAFLGSPPSQVPVKLRPDGRHPSREGD
jgi:hypothetical protein